MQPSDRAKLIPLIDYLEKELAFLSLYQKEIDWNVYQSQRSKRLEVERWIECLINATLDVSKMLLNISDEEIPETSREILFQMGSRIYNTEEESESFSDLAKIRNTLAHRYLDVKWYDIRRFFQISPGLYRPFLDYIKKEMGR